MPLPILFHCTQTEEREANQPGLPHRFDVHAFDQPFAYKDTGEKKNDGVSIGTRGPVTIQTAF